MPQRVAMSGASLAALADRRRRRPAAGRRGASPSMAWQIVVHFMGQDRIRCRWLWWLRL